MVPAHSSTAEPWNRGPRFTVPRISAVEPRATVPAHSSTAEPWNRGPWFRLTVPRLNRGTAGRFRLNSTAWNHGPWFRLTVPRLPTVEPRATVPAHSSTAEPWNRGPWFRLRGPRFRLTVPRLNRGNVSRGTGTVETVRFPSPPFSNFGSSDREQEKTREKHLPQEDEPTESTS